MGVYWVYYSSTFIPKVWALDCFLHDWSLALAGDQYDTLFSPCGVWKSRRGAVMNGRRTGSAVEKNEPDWEQQVKQVNDADRDYLQVWVIGGQSLNDRRGEKEVIKLEMFAPQNKSLLWQKDNMKAGQMCQRSTCPHWKNSVSTIISYWQKLSIDSRRHYIWPVVKK